MKFTITLFIAISCYTSLNAGIFLNQDSKQNQIIFNSMINSSIKNISAIFKQDSKVMIEKLQNQSINVRNEEQTIVQIALANAKEASAIISLIIKNLDTHQN